MLDHHRLGYSKEPPELKNVANIAQISIHGQVLLFTNRMVYTVVESLLPHLKTSLISALQVECPITALELQLNSHVFGIINLIDRDLVEINNTFRGLLIVVVFMTLVILQHSILKDKIPLLPLFKNELLRTQFLQVAFIKIILSESIIYKGHA